MSAVFETPSLFVMVPIGQARHNLAVPEGRPVRGLWRASLPWAPPAGFHDYTACLTRVAGALREGPVRIAAARGSKTDQQLGEAFATLGLDQHEAFLDAHRTAQILCEPPLAPDAADDALHALITLADMGLVNLALRDTTATASNAILGRRLRQPLSPGKPTFAHLLAARPVAVVGQASQPLLRTLINTRLKALARLGVDLEAASHVGRTPLHLAALAGNTAVITALADAGVALNTRDRYGFSALDLATRRNQHAAARRLIELGAQTSAAPAPAQKVALRAVPSITLTEHAA
ncbi:MAG: hypothetical protein RIR70_1679 [Pseudomonadota bacterium]|jgi:hypothetical protein